MSAWQQLRKRNESNLVPGLFARGWAKMAAKFKMAGANGYGGDWPKNEQYTVDLFFGWINVFIPSSLS